MQDPLKVLNIAKKLKGYLGLNRIRSDDLKLKMSINNSRSKTVVISNTESGSNVEFSSIVKASKYMGISPNHFNYYLVKQPIKGIYLVVKIDDIDVTADYQINKPSVNPNSLTICAIKMDTGLSYEFLFVTKAAEFLKVTVSFLSRCVRQGKSCKGYDVTRK